MESFETGKSQENLRLSDLIDFCVHSAKLRSRVVTTVAGHKEFSLFEDSLRGMPGVTVNPVSDADDGDEVWLRVQRIHESKPPEPTRAELKEWISLSKNPNVEPSLKEIPITDGPDLSLLQSLLADYKTRIWTPWAEIERPRQRSMKLYSELFTLKQRLEGGIVDSQIELVWGVGVAVQKTGAGNFQYPIITKLVELHLDSVTGAIEIRPRSLEPRLELDAFADQANSAVDKLEVAWREFLPTLQNDFSPFDRATYEPILNSAATFLDANGSYWPKIADAGDRALPKSGENLCVTDTWVLFARPRTNSAYLQDLERLKRAAETLGELPAAVLSLVKDSVGDAQESGFPEFRGVSSSYHSGGDSSAGKGRAQDLFFPKPFNDEQVRIIQLLEKYDGVVVQGPPGTGKTHTIANVICHYLANGKRVLVTSMKDPALGVLHGQLPDEIKPLAISLLSSEQEGMKKFEYSIQKIASEVQSINPVTTGKEIQNLEDQIHTLHGELMRIDHEISTWAKKNLEAFELDGEKLNPSRAASELVAQLGSFEYIVDPIDIDPSFDLQATDEDLRNLRQARQTLGNDIAYCQASLPQMIELPEAKALLLAHQDLSQFEQLKKQLESGQIPRLRDQEESTLQLLHDFAKKVESLQILNDGLGLLGLDWVGRVRSQARSLVGRPELSVVLEMGADLSQVNERRKSFLERPVKCPKDAERLDWFFNAVKNLSDGGSAFGLSGWFGKKQEKDLLAEVSVLGSAPKTPSDWAHVLRYLENQKWMLAQVVRWNAVAPELGLPSVPDEPSGALRVFENFEIFSKTKAEAVLIQEALALAKAVFPGWQEVENLLSDGQGLREIGRMVGHHLALQRLSNAWSRRESFQGTLQNHSGNVIESMRGFLNRTLGNPEVSDLEMQGQWSALTAELNRVLGLSGAVKTVMRVTSLIEGSGAPLFATKLRLPIDGVVDTLLPVDFSKHWRMARVSTHLAKVDGQDHLKSLAVKRRECELTLGRAYQDVIVKRTWLKLTQNATDRVRQALQAYLSAIKKIGKGTGKRAVRYRQDARAASETANPAVPCWIMPHYRISESLPAELGCFDLVIIDEASQSDLTALPAILRAKKVLIVGDDKQVSPEGVGLEEDRVRSLMGRFLSKQIDTFRPQMSPERSIYDLFKVVFAKSSVMLKEHFRCVGPIIEFSKREFYNHEIRPLRLPKKSERLDPPLIDVYVADGSRQGDTNRGEAIFIESEIAKIIEDPVLSRRSIGVVSLVGAEQAKEIWERLSSRFGPELLERHSLACGDARTFQGKERDIMFLSMVVAPNEGRIAPATRDTFAQRFNVAASRARDRMYLVRSVGHEHLSDKDVLRRNLISHFSSPFSQDEAVTADLRQKCESPFEGDVFDFLVERGYRVMPQVKVGHFRIDLVVEGDGDHRLAVECDGDQYHGPEKWADDMHRQRVLERAGWRFWRCFASTWLRRRNEMGQDLLRELQDRGVFPSSGQGYRISIHCEQRVVKSGDLLASDSPKFV